MVNLCRHEVTSPACSGSIQLQESQRWRMNWRAAQRRSTTQPVCRAATCLVHLLHQEELQQQQQQQEQLNHSVYTSHSSFFISSSRISPFSMEQKALLKPSRARTWSILPMAHEPWTCPTGVCEVLRSMQCERHSVNELLGARVRAIFYLNPVGVSDGGALGHEGEALAHGRRSQAQNHGWRRRRSKAVDEQHRGYIF